MYNCFLEIAYEAELKTDEDPELPELAAGLCGEDLNTRELAINELRDMIYEKGECLPHRTDDSFLIRFLRARNFTVPRAHRLLVNNCNFKKQYPYLYDGVDMWGLVKVKDVFECLMSDNPKYGRIGVLRLGRWNPSEFPAETIVQAGLLTMEIGLRSPKMQVIGGTLIVDLEGITMRHMAALTPTLAYQIVVLLGVVVPARLRSCHIINYSWSLAPGLYIFKRFIPSSVLDRVHIHNDIQSLQRHVDVDCLPEGYGGTDRSLTSFGTWLSKVKKYRTEEFDKEFKALGYVVKE